MLQYIWTLILIFILISCPDKAIAQSTYLELPKCVVLTHCVFEEWSVNNLEKTFSKAVDAVDHTPRTIIVEQTDFFIHAEAKTKWRRYTDDLLLLALPDKGVIQVRSESRVGIGDNGVNKRRVDDLAYRLITDY